MLKFTVDWSGLFVFAFLSPQLSQGSTTSSIVTVTKRLKEHALNCALHLLLGTLTLQFLLNNAYKTQGLDLELHAHWREYKVPTFPDFLAHFNGQVCMCKAMHSLCCPLSWSKRRSRFVQDLHWSCCQSYQPLEFWAWNYKLISILERSLSLEDVLNFRGQAIQHHFPSELLSFSKLCPPQAPSPDLQEFPYLESAT